MKHGLLLVVLLAITLAGCTDAPGPASDDATLQGDSDVDLPTGTLQVIVVDPDLRPIEGAEVVVDDDLRFTDSEGVAVFDEVTIGEQEILAQKMGFRDGRARIQVTVGFEAEATVKLLPGSQPAAQPSDDGSSMSPDDGQATDDNGTVEETGPEPYSETFKLRGFFDCSATYLIITGDCMLIADYTLDQVKENGGPDAPVRPGDHTDERYIMDVPLDLDWESVVAEMFWDPSTTAGQKMTFALEPAEFDGEGHAPKYARAGGGSPLRLQLDAGVPHETADTSVDGDEPGMPNPHGGEVLRTRSYVMGEGHNPGGTDFLGVGAHLQQDFEVIVTVFYHEPAPDGFTVQDA